MPQDGCIVCCFRRDHPQRLKKLSGPDGLGQAVGDADPAGLRGVHPDRGQHDQARRRQRGLGLDGAHQRQAVHLRHLVVDEHDAIRRALRRRVHEYRERLGTAAQAATVHAPRHALRVQDLAVGGVVVDDEHPNA